VMMSRIRLEVISQVFQERRCLAGSTSIAPAPCKNAGKMPALLTHHDSCRQVRVDGAVAGKRSLRSLNCGLNE